MTTRRTAGPQTTTHAREFRAIELRLRAVQRELARREAEKEYDRHIAMGASEREAYECSEAVYRQYA